MASLVRVARFFLVVPVIPPAMLAAFAVVTAAGIAWLVLDAGQAARAMEPLLLLQLFAAASGFRVPACRGHYDLLLTRGEARLAIAVVHWLMSVLPGLASWTLLALTERVMGGGCLTTSGTILTMAVASTVPWALTMPLPRLTGAMAWLLGLAATGVRPSAFVGVPLEQGYGLHGWVIAGLAAAVMIASLAWIRAMEFPLQSSQ